MVKSVAMSTTSPAARRSSGEGTAPPPAPRSHPPAPRPKAPAQYPPTTPADNSAHCSAYPAYSAGDKAPAAPAAPAARTPAAQALSLRLGCVRVTEKFFADPAAPLDQDRCLGLALFVKQELRRAGFRFDLPAPPEVVFTGGTITTIRMVKGARHGVDLAETPATVSVATVLDLLDELAPLDLAARKAIPGMPPARADVFPAALVTVLAVTESAGAERFHHSMHNLRWGVAAELLDRPV